MSKIFWHQELYGLLFQCEQDNIEKTVLDCGAGGPRPPLAIFQEHGFITNGIEISERSLQSAKKLLRGTAGESGLKTMKMVLLNQ